MKVAYKGYSAIIYNKSQILVRMKTTKDREVVKVIHNNETNYMTVFRDAILILSCTEKEKGIEYGLLSMQSAVMLGCERPADDHWVVLSNGNAVYFERCLHSCFIPVLSGVNLHFNVHQTHRSSKKECYFGWVLRLLGAFTE